jgi:putative transposase
MQKAGIRGISRRRAFTVTTRRNPRQAPAPALLNRRFGADAPNLLWVADMTYVPSWAGFIYLAVVLDVWSRRVVGWSIGEQMTGDLVLSALNMALEQRKPDGVIHHSDQGSQYTAIEFGKRCRLMGVRPSMGSVGDAYDNAMAESFFASLECELIDRRSFRSKAEARLAIFTYIEGWSTRAGATARLAIAHRSTTSVPTNPPCPPPALASQAPRRPWKGSHRVHRPGLKPKPSTLHENGASPHVGLLQRDTPGL